MFMVLNLRGGSSTIIIFSLFPFSLFFLVHNSRNEKLFYKKASIPNVIHTNIIICLCVLHCHAFWHWSIAIAAKNANCCFQTQKKHATFAFFSTENSKRKTFFLISLGNFIFPRIRISAFFCFAPHCLTHTPQPLTYSRSLALIRLRALRHRRKKGKWISCSFHVEI